MSEWSHLPNAAHIDRFIASVRERSGVWATAYTSLSYSSFNGSVLIAAQDAAHDAVWDAGRETVLHEAQYAAFNAGLYESYSPVRNAILALVAYDDCAQYLTMTPDELKVWYELSEHPACVLLLPAVITLQKETI